MLKQRLLRRESPRDAPLEATKLDRRLVTLLELDLNDVHGELIHLQVGPNADGWRGLWVRERARLGVRERVDVQALRFDQGPLYASDVVALTNDEAQAAYKVLAMFTREANLVWILSQVEDRLSVGKVSIKRVSSRDYPALANTWPGDEDEPKRRPSSAMFVASEEYSSQERLRVLTQALLAAVPAVHGIAATSLNTLKALGDVGSVRFAPEAEIKESFAIDSSSLARTAEGIARLQALLEELLQQVANGTPSEPAR